MTRLSAPCRLLVAVVSFTVVASLAACSRTPSSSAPVTLSSAHPQSVNIQFGWLPNVENAATILAKQKGYFTKQGVNVSILSGGPNVTVPSPIVSGKALMGVMTSESLAQANLSGADLVAVAATYQTSATCIMSLKGSGITKPQDLAGKRVGYGQNDETTMKGFFRHVGVKQNSFHRVTSNDNTATLISKQADATTCTLPNQPIEARTKGYQTDVMALTNYGYNRWSGLFAVSRSSLQDPTKRAEIAAMLRGIVQGERYALDNPKDAARAVYDAYGKKIGVTQQSQTDGLKVWNTLATKNTGTPLEITKTGIASQQTFLKQSGISATASTMFDTSLNSEVFGNGSR